MSNKSSAIVLMFLGACVGVCLVAFFLIASVGLFVFTRTSASVPMPSLTRSVSPTPHPLNELNLPFTRGAPPSTFDPARAIDTSSSEVIVEIFSGLVTLDPDLKIRPDIAESWTLSDDRRTYIFKLRENAKFQNGKPITAQDFKYSIERAADPLTRSPVARSRLGDIVGVIDKLEGRAKEVKGVQVIDDRNLQITIDAPKVYFLAQLATNVAFVVDQENVERGGSNGFLRPNGSGAYKLVDYIPNDRIVLERNDLYCGTPSPLVKTVTFWFSSSDSFLSRYQRDELDSSPLHATEIAWVFTGNNLLRTEATIAPTYRIEYIGIRTRWPPFDDVKIRQAFNLAIDKKGIADSVLYRAAIPAKGILPPGFPGFNSDVRGWDYDPLRARQLIKESRYGDVKYLGKIALEVSGQSMVIDPVVSMLRQNLGVDVEVRQTEFPMLSKDPDPRLTPAQLYSLGLVPEIADPVYLESLFRAEGASNSMGYANSDVDKLFEQARVEPDETKRFMLYRQAEQMIVNDAPWVPLLFNDNYWVTKSYVRGLTYPPMVVLRLKYVWPSP